MAKPDPVKEEDMGEEQEGEFDHDLDQDSGSGPGDDDGTGESKPSAPMQKRRRVTRACDECRRKKIKCDGKQPCTHCTVYSYECTYDQPSNRRRNPVPAYVEALEARVHLAEGLIRMIAPNLDLNDPALELCVRHGFIPGLKSSMPTAPPSAKATFPNVPAPTIQKNKEEPQPEADLESMIRAVGQIDLDDNGNWDYHGHSSGLSFIKRMREQLGDLMGPDPGFTPFARARKASNVIDSPRSSRMESPIDPTAPLYELPPEQKAREVCSHAVGRHSVLLRVVHVPSFWASFKRIYSKSPDQFDNKDQKFSILLYAAMALGTAYGPQDPSGYATTTEKGFEYFQKARHLMDMADIRDLTSIQAVTFMVMFLQNSARLTQCYSYIGVGLRACIRLGMHRSLPSARFTPLEAEMRKRVFWTLRKLDIYTGAILGLPPSFNEDDIDQDFPLEVEDDDISDAGINTQKVGTVTMMKAFNVNTRLVIILSKIIRTIYPIRPNNGNPNKSYAIPFSKIKDIEQDLEDWKAALPPEFDPSNKDPKLQRAQQALRVTYAFNQILLYRPFLHFVEADKRKKQIDQRAYACAASYIHVCRNLIHLSEARQKEGMLVGSLWFVSYSTFFAILSLVYFAAENTDNPTTQDLMKDALKGREILASVASVSMSADRCTTTLDRIFNRLPDWMREGKPNPVPKRKRKQATDPRPSQSGASVRGMPPQGLAPIEVSRDVSPMTMGGHGGPFTPQGQGSSYSRPFTPTDYSPTTQTLQQFGLQPTGSSDVTDITSMIFSSAEPFTYPNQPLTTYESNQNFKEGGMYDLTGSGTAVIGHTVMPSGSTNRPSAEMLEAQTYGLPPFVLQPGQWTAEPQSMRNHGSMSGSGAGGGVAHGRQSQQQYMMQQQHSSGGPSQSWPLPQGPNGNANNSDLFQNQGFEDINFQMNQIFGGPEWSGPLMNQDFNL